MTQPEKFAKISPQPSALSPQPSALSNNSVQISRKQININGQILKPRFNWYELMREYLDDSRKDFRNKNISREDASRLFTKTKELFDREGIKFALVFGTLLGAVREKGIIKGDSDMDIFTCDECYLVSKLAILQQEGLTVWKIFPGALYSFMIDDSCYIDVYIMSELKGLWRLFYGKSLVTVFIYQMPSELFSGWSEVEFLGQKCTCPANPERLLEFWYGPGWRIPQNKKGTYRLQSVQTFYRFVNSPVLLVRKVRYIWSKLLQFFSNKD